MDKILKNVIWIIVIYFAIVLLMDIINSYSRLNLGSFFSQYVTPLVTGLVTGLGIGVGFFLAKRLFEKK